MNDQHNDRNNTSVTWNSEEFRSDTRFNCTILIFNSIRLRIDKLRTSNKYSKYPIDPYVGKHIND